MTTLERPGPSAASFALAYWDEPGILVELRDGETGLEIIEKALQDLLGGEECATRVSPNVPLMEEEEPLGLLATTHHWGID